MARSFPTFAVFGAHLARQRGLSCPLPRCAAVRTRYYVGELREVAETADLRAAGKPGRTEEDLADGLYIGGAIRFFLDAERAGGRSGRTLLEYREKLDLFRRRAAARPEGEGAVDAPVSRVGPDEVEGYVVD